MERTEEFTRDGKNFIYIDFTGLKTNEDFLEATRIVKSVIEKYPEKSLYTITNIENIRFDSFSKRLVADYMQHNAPYVKHGVVIGLDGIKKMMVNTVMKLSGRTNMSFAFTKEGAVEWILQHE